MTLVTRERLLRVEALQTHLGGMQAPVRAVDGVDLEIRRGETFALLGESGCGKSMTALSIMRLLPPSGRIVGGSVRLHDRDLLDLPERDMRRVRGGGLGMIFQEPMTSLNPVMTVGEQIAEAVRIHDPGSRGGVRDRVVELLQQVGIPDAQRRSAEYPHQLSGGMKQRAMIAMALAGRPQLLIADEPTTALDVTIQAQVLQLLKDLQRASGMAVLLITHDLGVVAETADRVAVMYAGQIVETADCDTFFREPLHPYSRKLFQSLPTAAKRAAALDVIPGTVPSLQCEFVGCRFAERCPAVLPICRERAPDWARHAGHGVRCHLDADTVVASIAAPARSAVVTTHVASAAPAGDELLRLQDLKVHFPIRKGVLRRTVGHVRAVDGVSLAVRRGRTLALVGESGCGKTTVGKAALRLLEATAGRIDFAGTDLASLDGAELRRRRRDFQIIFQDPGSAMNPRMLVEDIVAEGMVAQRIVRTRTERAQRVRELLQQVGLSEDAARRYPHEFSGGQKQRICVARALALQPKLIVCDEPTSALDISVQAQVLNLLKALQDEMGLSYLFITHDLSVVSYLAHEVAVMYLGRIVERGSVEEVLSDPRHPYTQALLSAVPEIDSAARRPVIRLQGDLPSPAAPPSGCHFHPRCPQASATCRKRYPQPLQLSPSRTVSCHLVSA